MPNRRRMEKGSFGGSFDELLKVFPGESSKEVPGSERKRTGSDDERHINDKLFEAAWRKARTTSDGHR
jgi:hypothetical protein